MLTYLGFGSFGCSRTRALTRGGTEVPKIEVDVERCKGCGYCVEACPQDILELAERFNSMG